MTDLQVYDTTLRDGAQQEGLNLSVADKLAIAMHLDELGVGFIEGGWPGANPEDTEFFARAQRELSLRSATLAAFGATRRAGTVAAADRRSRPCSSTRASPRPSPMARQRGAIASRRRRCRASRYGFSSALGTRLLRLDGH